jgi:tetratricopeptide (TPR) repeat protein
LGAAQREASTFPQDDPRRMQTVQELADLYVRQERYSDAEPLYWKVLPSLGRRTGTGDMEMAGVLTNLGKILWKKGKIGDAEAMCKRALALTAGAHAPDSEDTAVCSDVLAQIALQSGDYSEAEQLAKKALEIREKLPGADERTLANNLRLLAKIQVAQQQYAEAEPTCQRALDLSEKVFGRNTAQVLESLDLYSETLTKLNRLTEARRLDYRAKLLRSKLGSPAMTR